MLPDSQAYNFTACLELRGRLDATALAAALDAVVNHHPGLRLELADPGAAPPMQRVAERTRARLRTSDLSGVADPAAAFAALLAAEAAEPLDTGAAPLLRWHLVRTGDDSHRLVHVEHHLIHDGHSFAILLRDVFTAYTALVTGARVELTPAPSYEDFARSRAGGHEKGLAFWREELADAPRETALPGLTRPGARRRHRGAQLRRGIPADLAERLRAVGRDGGHTPFSALLTLFAELLRRHSGHADLVVGTAVGNRPPAHQRTVGMFVNTVPLRLRLRPDEPAEEVVDDVTEVLLRALPHQDVPIQRLTHELGLHTTGTDNPLFSVMFSAHDAALPQIDVPGLDIRLTEGFNLGTTRFDLDVVLLPDDRRTVGARDGAAGMTLIWDYDTDLFAARDVELLAARLLELVSAFVAAPAAPLAGLAAPARAPRTEPVGLASLDPVPGPDAGRIAVVSGRQQVTYGDLDRRVTELAGRMRDAGVRPGQPVAAVLPRGLDTITTLLACLRTGAVYAPLSPADPPARLGLLLRRLAPALVLTTREGAPALPSDVRPALLDGPPFPPAAEASKLDGAAYVIHTSGSTGVPKAVVVGRAALAGYLTAITGRYDLRPADRVLVFAQPAFDVALEELLPSLTAGATLVLPVREAPTGPELAAVLAARGVTVANLPTSYFTAVRDDHRGVVAGGRG